MTGTLFLDFRVLLHDADKPASEHLDDARAVAAAIEDVLKSYDDAVLIVREATWSGAAR